MIFKKLFRNGFNYLTDKKYRFTVNRKHFGMYHDMPDDEYLKRLFHYNMGYELDLDNPKTFSEKLQWLKLYDRNPIYTTMVDKFEMKQYVAEIIGDKYIIPTLGIWENAENIDFNAMPDQFVLKCTHDSHDIIICKDKAKFDITVAKKKMQKGLQRNYFYAFREWCYKDIKPRIIAEQFMDNHGEDLIDFKVHNFNGVPKVILVCANRFSDKQYTQDFFDCNWKHLPVKRPKSQNDSVLMKKPDCIQEMLEISRILSKDIPFIRTDFYIIEGKLYVGELTFFPASGLLPFEPESFDYELGSYLTLPDKNF